MSDAVEIEVKLVATPAMLKRLLADPRLAGHEHVASLVSTYFDTSGWDLRKAGAGLRLRGDGDTREHTLKLAPGKAGAITRREWNAPAKGKLPRAEDFPVRPGRMLARLCHGKRLVPFATVRVERLTRKVHWQGAVIELAFDRGEIDAGGRSEPICEIELELLEGPSGALYDLALALPLGPELQWSVASKAARGQQLALGVEPEASRGGVVPLEPGMSAARAFQAIGRASLGQILANYPLIVRSGDPEAVHQMRVAIRRLRALWQLFCKLAEDDEVPVLNAGFKAAADGLGPARDLHVLNERVARADPHGEADAGLIEELHKREVEAVEAARAMLLTEGFQRHLVSFALWLETGKWRKSATHSEGGQPARRFAARALRHLRRKLRRGDGDLSKLGNGRLHRLRIKTKRLRYASTALAPLFAEKDRARALERGGKALSQLQDRLGELHDLAMAGTMSDRLFAGADPIEAARNGAELSLVLAGNAPSRRDLVKAAQRALDAYLAIAPGWKRG